jgi:glycosyltransferase involved in cell wall biosynthesis
MQVSYIITTYNRHELLQRAINFVAREQCADSELIIVDDNSQPPVDIAPNNFIGNITLVVNKSNLGVIGARNAGLAVAKGAYVLFLDDDDESLENRTRDLLDSIRQTSCDFVAAKAYMEQELLPAKLVPESSAREHSVDSLLHYPSHIDAIIWKRSALALFNGLDNRVPYLGEHITQLLLLARGGSGRLIDIPVATFGYIPQGLTRQTLQENKLTSELIQMFQVLLEEDNTPRHQQLYRSIQQQLKETPVLDFDEYLMRLQEIF